MFKVLMVDDEPDAEHLFRQNFRREIRRKDYEFLFAQSADQALQLLQDETSPEVMAVLSDINMPGMTGLDLLDVVKRRTPDLTVIMITAYGDAGTETEARRRGAARLVSKPVDFADLKSELAGLADRTAP
ncbi:MAG: response regulator [Antarcticimicrobium sp.]|uniref:response regulator n=1 Tax=Antarcticimicrobium sp. TaxID=2824147 RepID=UPI00262641FF|nr:response regulator [Antarcticimicrobium sp.]MDF1715759.1 response regulator [Antarcticimicrobium sp.]